MNCHAKNSLFCKLNNFGTKIHSYGKGFCGSFILGHPVKYFIGIFELSCFFKG